ncbi:MAG: hypothetical protein OXC30_00225 [Alphaproteobacteria bacterium]|nr:hypothetical protein [Alphaproteobacteria bacterium]
MKYLLLIMLPVILLGAMSKEVAEPSMSGPEEKGRRVMPVILSKFEAAYMKGKLSLLQKATEDVMDFFRENYRIEKGFLRLTINPFLWKKADGVWETLSDSEPSDTQGFHECHLLNLDRDSKHWMLRFFVRQECFREIDEKCQMIQAKFSSRSDLDIKYSFLLSSFFSACFSRDVEIITR